MRRYRKIYGVLLLIILSMIFTKINSYSENNIDNDLDNLSTISDLDISDFMDLVDDNKEYEVVVIDMNEGLNYPILIKDNNIQSIKENIISGKIISKKDITDKKYPKIFESYDVKYIEGKTSEFVVFIKSNTIPVVFSDNSTDLKVRINGQIKEISLVKELERGRSYDLAFYKNDKNIGEVNVDLTNYEGKEYEIAVPSTGIFNGISLVEVIIIIISSILIILVYKLKKKPPQPPIEPPTQPINIVTIGEKLINIYSIIYKNRYEFIIKNNVIEVIDYDFDILKMNKKDTVDFYNRKIDDILGKNPDEKTRYKIQILKDEFEKLGSKIDYDGKKIKEIENSLYKIRKYNDEDKIEGIEEILNKAAKIYLNLDTRNFEMENLLNSQKEILNSYEYEKIIYFDNTVRYEEIIDNYNKLLRNILEFLVKQGNDIELIKLQFSSFVGEINKLNERIENLYEKLEQDTINICNIIESNQKSIDSAMMTFDKKVSSILNKNIDSLRKDILQIKNQIDKECDKDKIKEYEEWLQIYEEKFNEALDFKFKNIEMLIEKFKESHCNEENINKYLSKKSIEKIDKETENALNTAEYLYNNNLNNPEISDYSCIYIMYSKVLEKELYKKTKQKDNKSTLWEIECDLEHDKVWGRLITVLRDNNIRDYRNNAAHKGSVDSKEVKIIRGILLDESKNDNKICWLEFIINEN